MPLKIFDWKKELTIATENVHFCRLELASRNTSLKQDIEFTISSTFRLWKSKIGPN